MSPIITRAAVEANAYGEQITIQVSHTNCCIADTFSVNLMRVYPALTNRMLSPLLSGEPHRNLRIWYWSSLNYKKSKKLKKLNVSHYVAVYPHNLISKCRTNEACARIYLLALPWKLSVLTKPRHSRYYPSYPDSAHISP